MVVCLSVFFKARGKVLVQSSFIVNIHERAAETQLTQEDGEHIPRQEYQSSPFIEGSALYPPEAGVNETRQQHQIRFQEDILREKGIQSVI